MGYYIPKTFFVEKLGVSGIDSYIDKQKNNSKKKNRIIMLAIHIVHMSPVR